MTDRWRARERGPKGSASGLGDWLPSLTLKPAALSGTNPESPHTVPGFVSRGVVAAVALPACCPPRPQLLADGRPSGQEVSTDVFTGASARM